jgi:N-acetyl sugar amidotransferase
MDSSDAGIEFDEAGVCNHCRGYAVATRRFVRTGETAERELAVIVEQMKRDGRGRDYDCVIGVSGGVDSTYVAHIVSQLGLRALAVHVDNGWDSELAVHNIERVLNHLGIDLYTEVLDWEEFRDLQLAFLRASLPDGDVPTDHAILAVLYGVAAKLGIRHIISGSNTVTEGVLPSSWTYGIGDWRYIRAVHRRHGTRALKSYPHVDLARLIYYSSVKRIRSVRILDYVPYVRTDVMKVLQDELGWQYYGGKHYESVYTRFFQGYVLPRKFNIDKRLAHLSALVASGQLERDAALAELESNPYSDAQQQMDREYVCKKLELGEAEFAKIMELPIRSAADFPNTRRLVESARSITERLGIHGLLKRVVRIGGL